MRRTPRVEPDIEIRPPLSWRLGQVALGGVGAWVALTVTLTLAERATIWAALAGVALVVWVTYFYRMINMAVLVHGDVLTARNLLRTRHVCRNAVAAIVLAESSIAKSPNQTVVIRTDTGGEIALDACARTVQTRRKARRVEDFQHRLVAWRETPAGGSEPAGDELLVQDGEELTVHDGDELPVLRAS